MLEIRQKVTPERLVKAFMEAGIDYQTFFLFLLTRQGTDFPWEAYMHQLAVKAKEQKRLDAIVKCFEDFITEAKKLE